MGDVMNLFKEKNNKGFTLVELVIVIAIIAVLATVISTQYLQYVERTRQANDVQVATQIMRATTAVMNDPNNGLPSGTNFTVTWHSVDDDSVVVGWRSEGTIEVDPDVTSYEAAIRDAMRLPLLDVMGWYDTSKTNQWIGQLGESKVALETDFTFTINSSSGEISGIPQEWLDMGVNAGQGG